MTCGILVDYRATTIHPCTLPSIATLLWRTRRYGCHGGPDGIGVDVLTHSLHVGRVAKEIGRRIGESESVQAALELYGRLHDIGEIFGGDVNVHVPRDAIHAFRAWQSTARERLQAQLGIPRPALIFAPILSLADKLVVPSEIVSFGGMSPASSTLRGALQEAEATADLESGIEKLRAELGLKETVTTLVRKAHALRVTDWMPGSKRSLFRRAPELYLLANDLGRVVRVEPTPEEMRTTAQGFLASVSINLDGTVIATAPLNQKMPADVWTLPGFLSGFPKRETP